MFHYKLSIKKKQLGFAKPGRRREQKYPRRPYSVMGSPTLLIAGVRLWASLDMGESLFDKCGIDKSVNIPVELYESWKGRYFIGYADDLTLGKGKSAWARLYNPPGSGVTLFVNVWTVTELSSEPFRAQFWFNAVPPNPPPLRGGPVDNHEPGLLPEAEGEGPAAAGLRCGWRAVGRNQGVCPARGAGDDRRRYGKTGS